MRQVRVLATKSFNLSDDPDEFYIGPDREDVLLEGVGCTVEEFLDWFMETEEGEKFCRISGGMTDIGGSKLDLSEGALINVTWDEYFDRYLEKKAYRAKKELKRMCTESMELISNHNNKQTRDAGGIRELGCKVIFAGCDLEAFKRDLL